MAGREANLVRPARLLLLCSLGFVLCFARVTAAQEESPLHVGVMGAIPEPVKPIHPPEEIASLLPQDATVRVLTNTDLSPSGETTIVYATVCAGDEDAMEAEPHIAVVRDGKIVGDFAPGDGGYLAAFDDFHLGVKSNAVVIALRNYGDGATTDFYLLRFDGRSYLLDEVAHTYAGRMEIMQTNPAEFRVWSAGVDDTCVWCAQRYHTDVYRWRNGRLALESRAVTSAKFYPSEINQHPILTGPVGPKSAT